MATYFRTDGWVKTALGAAIPGAQIYVCNQPANIPSNLSVTLPSPLATIFSDVNGLVPITQPIITDGFGHYDFYTSPGTYTLVIAYGGLVQQVYPDQNVAEGSPTSGSIVSSDGSVAVTQNVSGNTNLAVQTITASFMLGPGILNPILAPITTLAAIGNGTANAVWVCKFFLAASISGLTHLDGNFGCNLGPGSNFSIGIYDTSGNKLWTSGTLHVANIGFISSSYAVPALTLAAGTYYYAWTCDDTGNTTARGCNNLSLMSFISSTSDGNVINQGSIVLGLATNVSTAGAVLPSTLGALSIPSVTMYTPLVMFR